MQALIASRDRGSRGSAQPRRRQCPGGVAASRWAWGWGRSALGVPLVPRHSPDASPRALRPGTPGAQTGPGARLASPPAGLGQRRPSKPAGQTRGATRCFAPPKRSRPGPPPSAPRPGPGEAPPLRVAPPPALPAVPVQAPRIRLHPAPVVAPPPPPRKLRLHSCPSIRVQPRLSSSLRPCPQAGPPRREPLPSRGAMAPPRGGRLRLPLGVSLLISQHPVPPPSPRPPPRAQPLTLTGCVARARTLALAPGEARSSPLRSSRVLAPPLPGERLGASAQAPPTSSRRPLGVRLEPSGGGLGDYKSQHAPARGRKSVRPLPDGLGPGHAVGAGSASASRLPLRGPPRPAGAS